MNYHKMAIGFMQEAFKSYEMIELCNRTIKILEGNNEPLWACHYGNQIRKLSNDAEYYNRKSQEYFHKHRDHLALQRRAYI